MYLKALGWAVLAVAFYIPHVGLNRSQWGEWPMFLWMPAYGCALAAVMTFIFKFSVKWQLACFAVPFLLMAAFLLMLWIYQPTRWT